MSRIGVDVGGTNTDAVLLDSGSVIHSVKTPTTRDITAGILTALVELARHPKVLLEAIDGVVIGTTHFVNAVLQRRDLARVAAVRIGLPASASLPPFCDWPADLARRVRSEEHTSELQSHVNLVCRLLLEKKNHLLVFHGGFSA